MSVRESMYRMRNKIVKEALTKSDKISNVIRDFLTGSGRTTTQKEMWALVKKQFAGIKEPAFKEVWDSLIEDKFLVPAGKNEYKWEM